MEICFGNGGANGTGYLQHICARNDGAKPSETIADTALRSKTGALILAVRRAESDLATPGADFQLDAGDVLVVVGQPQQIKSAYQLLTGADGMISV